MYDNFVESWILRRNRLDVVYRFGTLCLEKPAALP